MPKIPLDQALEGDVLSKDVVVGTTAVFGTGTVLIKKIIEILEKLRVKEIYIEGREGGKFRSLNDLLDNIEQRFSCAGDSEIMRHLKYLAKDIASVERGYR